MTLSMKSPRCPTQMYPNVPKWPNWYSDTFWRKELYTKYINAILTHPQKMCIYIWKKIIIIINKQTTGVTIYTFSIYNIVKTLSSLHNIVLLVPWPIAVSFCSKAEAYWTGDGAFPVTKGTMTFPSCAPFCPKAHSCLQRQIWTGEHHWLEQKGQR